MTNNKNSNQDTQDLSRRKFLKSGGLVAGGLLGGSLFGGLLTNQFQKGTKDEKTPQADKPVSFDARTFFSRNEDFALLSAATERIYPENKNGMGAIELGVPYFIDRQCASNWGRNADDYMHGPFPTVIKTDGYKEEKRPNNEVITSSSVVKVPAGTANYQTKMTRGTFFLEGLTAMEKTSQDKFGDRFVNLEPEQQDEILKMFEKGEVKFSGVDSSDFFNLLRQTTIEGVYADPVYGGNRNMEAWRMKEYPGPIMSFLDKIEEEEFIVMEPSSLRNYQGL
ncbi:dehydrogenase [Sporosarcina sp. P34]|uniref:gluconate 2-dehydrogenase subunit 3 family protein n=1 Tax=Sporosarcina sp. P34 TaxID=2048247 RepID=UPI000C1671FC|nr:gluconate 2-dehydrogenase subunit 3 family protein [Sporosarcina sp. P34]PID15706.1 dehydrogenase [Sporosarcina sp. P34]